MKRLVRFALCLVFSSISVAFGHTEHNSFLETPANSTASLVAEVEHNPVVLKRYERQFMMSEQALVHYFSGLHVESLREDRRYLVYNVDDSLVIRSRQLHLTKGTLVFADADHQPVLKCSCGNPMISAAPALGENDSSVHTLMAEIVPFTRSAESPDDNQPMLAEDTDVTMTGDEPTIDDTEVAEVPEFRPEPIASPPVAGVVPAPIFGGGPPLGWLGVIPILGLIPIIDHPRGGGPPIIAATPEPASFAPLAIGIVALGWKRRKK